VSKTKTKLDDPTTDEHPELSTRSLRQGLSDAINRAAYGNERIVVTHHGSKRAAIISLEDLKLLDQFQPQKK